MPLKTEAPDRDSWPPPRGPKPEWPTLWQRAEDTYDAGRGVERRAVDGYRVLVAKLAMRSRVTKMSIRDIARTSGVAASGVSALLTGSAWPRLDTMCAVARVLDCELHIGGDPDLAGHLLGQVRSNPDLSISAVASDAGMRRNTLSELAHPSRSPSMRTILALAGELDLTVELRLDPEALWRDI